MGKQAATRQRVKISATLDPVLVSAVDVYVAEHAGLARGAVIDEALRLWYARQQELAMEEQYADDAEAPPEDEWAAWRAVQQASARHLLGQQ